MILLNTKWPTGTEKLENWPKLENAMDFSLAIRMCTRKAVLQALTSWDERVYKLHDVFNEENRCLEYEYDFGASWNHVIQFEGQEEDISKNGEFPSCVDGRGANRMEDCEDETSDGELKPSFKRKKFNLKQAQRNLRKIFAEKWPFSNVDSAKTPKCMLLVECQKGRMSRDVLWWKMLWGLP